MSRSEDLTERAAVQSAEFVLILHMVKIVYGILGTSQTYPNATLYYKHTHHTMLFHEHTHITHARTHARKPTHPHHMELIKELPYYHVNYTTTQLATMKQECMLRASFNPIAIVFRYKRTKGCHTQSSFYKTI